MSVFDRFPPAVESDEHRRPMAGRLSDRLVRTFGAFDRTRDELPEWQDTSELDFPTLQPADASAPWEADLSGFPPVRNGYDPDAVDQRIAELEREIDQLRISRQSTVTAELERIGEQTSAILVSAHEQAAKMLQEAREQADRCVQDAAANAVQMQARAQAKVRELDDDTESLWQERMRLIEDARTLGASLISLAADAGERFPAEMKLQPTVAIDPIAEDPAATASDPDHQ